MMDSHLTQNELLRSFDDELLAHEAELEAHLDSCDVCRAKMRELGAFSGEINDVLLALPVSDVRKPLVLRTRKSWTGWYSGIAAAAIAAGVGMILLTPKVATTPTQIQASVLQVDGETFTALPYSNSDIGPVAPRIVEMQVPVANLIDAGVAAGPVSIAAADPDRTVRADVLLGADGEPMGIHVLESL